MPMRCFQQALVVLPLLTFFLSLFPSYIEAGGELSNSLSLFFTTPILQRTLVQPAACVEIHAELLDAIFTRFGEHKNDGGGTLNDSFYRSQLPGGLNHGFLESSPHFASLQDVVLTLSQTMLTALLREPASLASRDGNDEEEFDKSKFSSFAWANVLTPHGHHPPHLHGDSALSAVFFLQVPPSSGSLVLEDPRGPYGPFSGQQITQKPVCGEVIIFPSWLRHRVEPGYEGADLGEGTCESTCDSTTGGDARFRVSLSFNIFFDLEAFPDHDNLMTMSDVGYKVSSFK